MGRKGENKQTKRSKAPSFWTIHRKSHQFTINTSPGPYRKKESYPISVLIRDILKIVNTYDEAKSILKDGKVSVDGIIRRKKDYPVGLMNIVEIPILKKNFRMLPAKNALLIPIEIPESEKNLKLCEVITKTSVRGGKVQYGLHDGRSILAESEIDLKPHDTCLLEVPSQKIIRTISLKKEILALVIRGRRAGKIGKIKEIRQGSFTKQKMIDLEIEGSMTELPSDMIIPIGEDTPLIIVSGGN